MNWIEDNLGIAGTFVFLLIAFVLFLVVRFIWRILSQKGEQIANVDQEFLRLNAGHMLEQISYYRSANSRARISFLLSILASTAGVGLIGLMLYKQQGGGIVEANPSLLAFEAGASILSNFIGLVLWNNAKREKEDERKYFDCLRVDSGRYQAWLIINNLKAGEHRKEMETLLIKLLLSDDLVSIPDVTEK